MQIKYIVATIASLAISNVIASPIAMPAPEAENELTRRAAMTQLAKEAEDSVHVMQELSNKFSARLQEEADKNYKQTNAKIPTIEEIQELKRKMEEKKNTGTGKRDANAEPQWWGYNAAWYGQNWNWNYQLGWQTYYPFWSNSWLYGNNIWNYYTGFGTACGWGWC
ncbi:hypothetical protein HII31_11576 [Pseudocercospora fuligena]|uniref:Uncharacterized protein n=1 Tax=Pseudocercospora fuligena TaxID=685502 RepID=A0A8H6R9X8_9PEZI|nr:hypothetical protein HII31_11576 [Pseudocercospora fuligena]